MHLFIAIGAVLALFAMLAAGNQQRATMFLWLMAAMMVDGLDGPLARHFLVESTPPAPTCFSQVGSSRFYP